MRLFRGGDVSGNPRTARNSEFHSRDSYYHQLTDGSKAKMAATNRIAKSSSSFMW